MAKVSPLVQANYDKAAEHEVLYFVFCWHWYTLREMAYMSKVSKGKVALTESGKRLEGFITLSCVCGVLALIAFVSLCIWFAEHMLWPQLPCPSMITRALLLVGDVVVYAVCLFVTVHLEDELED